MVMKNVVIGVFLGACSLLWAEPSDAYTHFAHVAGGFDASSVQFEEVRMVALVTGRNTIANTRYCEEAAKRDSSGSSFCNSTEPHARSSAYRVTYSYTGSAMASDEYGGNRYTFSVYFRPDELNPEVLQKLADRKLRKTSAAELFKLSSETRAASRRVIDSAASKFCEGSYTDGCWQSNDSHCADQISYKQISSPSTYVTFRVEPASSNVVASK